MMAYSCLEQRTAKTVIDHFPPFVPDRQAPVSAAEQELFYGLIRSMLQLAFDEPNLFITTLHDDDVFTKEKRNEYKIHMRKFVQAIYDLVQNMFHMGKGSDVKLSKRQQAVLSRIGVSDFANLPAAWVWMSTRDEAELTEFFYCLFDKNYSYGSDIYARLLGEKAFRGLESRLLEKGYKPFSIYGLTAGFPVISMTYANTAWSGEQPAEGYLYKIKHTGVSTLYFYYNENPASLGLCIPNSVITPFLKAFDSMPDKLQKFVIEHNTKCWNCRYCVQTDKTGKRPLVFVPATYEEKEYNLCPRFPGSAYNWNSINDELADDMLEMLTFLDSFAPSKTE